MKFPLRTPRILAALVFISEFWQGRVRFGFGSTVSGILSGDQGSGQFASIKAKDDMQSKSKHRSSCRDKLEALFCMALAEEVDARAPHIKCHPPQKRENNMCKTRQIQAGRGCLACLIRPSGPDHVHVLQLNLAL